MSALLQVLCSPASLQEARSLVDLGVDIIDIKNPSEGSLGAQTPWVVREISDYVKSKALPVSAALGDLAFQPGTASLAAYGLAQLGVRYIKAGLYGTYSGEQAVEQLAAIRRAIDMVDDSIALVAAGYGDYRSFGGLDPTNLVQAAIEARCRLVMLDTATKKRGSLFDFLDEQELHRFVTSAHAADLTVALAGSIDAKHVSALRRLAPDIIGVRGALCRAGDRTQRIDPEQARKFLDAVRLAEPQPHRLPAAGCTSL